MNLFYNCLLTFARNLPEDLWIDLFSNYNIQMVNLLGKLFLLFQALTDNTCDSVFCLFIHQYPNQDQWTIILEECFLFIRPRHLIIYNPHILAQQYCERLNTHLKLSFLLLLHLLLLAPAFLYLLQVELFFSPDQLLFTFIKHRKKILKIQSQHQSFSA